MDFGVAVLAFGTLGFVAVFAYLSARATDELRRSGGPKSALSKDGIAERVEAQKS